MIVMLWPGWERVGRVVPDEPQPTAAHPEDSPYLMKTLRGYLRTPE